MVATTLQIKEDPAIGADGRVVLTLLDGSGGVIHTANAKSKPWSAAQEQEDLRWYMEDYRQFPQKPAPSHAKRIEQWMTRFGSQLFSDLFETEDARMIWKTIQPVLATVRLEIISPMEGGLSVPWELARDSSANSPLALQSRAFVHAIHGYEHARPIEFAQTDRIRILLVICRPAKAEDVPFRSIANSLVKELGGELKSHFQIDVLRPPTLARLSEVLEGANEQGRPYHIVHFDGHGLYEDLTAQILGTEPKNRRGYVVFEGDCGADEYVDGSTIGQMLLSARVPILVLNACRSGRAELRSSPKSVGPERQRTPFGSLAEEVIRSGVLGVVAMRYNVYVGTASQFMTNLYSAFAQGTPLAEAVAEGRKGLAQERLRKAFYNPLLLEDWLVPVVYEASPFTIPLSPILNVKSRGSVSGIARTREVTVPTGRLESHPSSFVGANEILLTLDRAFDSYSVVLIYGFAGGGKSAVAAEFSRWYVETGGVKGVALHSSFETHTSLTDLFEQLKQVLSAENVVEESRPSLKGPELRRRMLGKLKETQVFWVWDNVERITGFPKGNESLWEESEQTELAQFLREANEQTEAKFLLVSRRTENHWLGKLPFETYIPYLSSDERIQLTQLIADGAQPNEEIAVAKQSTVNVLDWYPVLRFTKGNPLTISIVLRRGLAKSGTSPEITKFLEDLRDGRDCFNDCKGAREVSLHASLSYGFKEAFSDEETRQLGALYFFQSIVNVESILKMADKRNAYSLPQLEALTSESAIAILNRCSEIGLMRSSGGGYYVNHPMTPWFFRGFFEKYYDSRAGAKAFVQAMVEISGELAAGSIRGFQGATHGIQNEESNLLQARRIAIREGWVESALKIMTALRELYEQNGRHNDWDQLVEDIAPYCLEGTDLPVAGLEQSYHLIIDFKVLAAQKTGKYQEAERLQELFLDWSTHRTADDITYVGPSQQEAPAGDYGLSLFQESGLPFREYFHLRTQASALNRQAETLRALLNPKCLEVLMKTLEISQRINDRLGKLSCEYNLALSFITVPSVLDLDEAARWARRAFDTCPKHDNWRLGKCHKLLGMIAQLRSDQLPERSSHEEVIELLNMSHSELSRALALLPDGAVDDRAETHDLLGDLYRRVGRTDSSLEHFRKSLRYKQLSANKLGAAQTRLRMALSLAKACRFVEAKEYVIAARQDFDSFGTPGAEGIRVCDSLLEQIIGRTKE